jgi:hypothetical protein
VRERERERERERDKEKERERERDRIPQLVQVYLAHKKVTPPRTLGIGHLQGPRSRRFLVSEVSL